MKAARVKPIVIDFDGTCVAHEYPKIGKEIGAVPVLLELVDNGYALIMRTMRSGKPLDEAIEWFKGHGIALFCVNLNPQQSTWTSSPKIYGHLYIDDAALGCPLVHDDTERPYVDWVKAREMLVNAGFIS